MSQFSCSGGTDVLPQLSKLFCQLKLHCLEELGYSVSFPDNNLASMACAIPEAVCYRQRFILHYLSASKHRPLLSSTVAHHAEATVQHACWQGASMAFSPEWGTGLLHVPQ